MERIVIEVTDEIAQKWQNVPLEIKQRLEKSFERQIDFFSQKMKEAKFEDLLNKAREEASQNGLTEEILQQLLNEE